MKVLVTGASGRIGSGVVKRLADNGDTVFQLTRSKSKPPPRWDPATGLIDFGKGLSFDAVVHLAGESIAGRWTAERKRWIRDSRVQGTRLLCEALARLPQPPRVLLCASAIGIYGNRSDEVLDESSTSGAGFLAEVCREWEAATLSAAEKRIRVVNLRLGIVLTPKGGALKAMLWPFRLGVGGRVGNGQQYLSWITLGDVERAADHALRCDQLQGPLNLVAPTPVTNQEFTRTLARALNRPACLPMPGFVARTLFGKAADALLLASARVLPTRLRETGFQFEHPDLESALRELLKR